MAGEGVILPTVVQLTVSQVRNSSICLMPCVWFFILPILKSFPNTELFFCKTIPKGLFKGNANYFSTINVWCCVFNITIYIDIWIWISYFLHWSLSPYNRQTHEGQTKKSSYYYQWTTMYGNIYILICLQITQGHMIANSWWR